MTSLWSLLLHAHFEMADDGLGGNAGVSRLAERRVERLDESLLGILGIDAKHWCAPSIKNLDVGGHALAVRPRFYGVTKSGNAIAQSVVINEPAAMP
jgi:hypothetical protein